jgi:hypothetical protein
MMNHHSKIITNININFNLHYYYHHLMFDFQLTSIFRFVAHLFGSNVQFLGE